MYTGRPLDPQESAGKEAVLNYCRPDAEYHPEHPKRKIFGRKGGARSSTTQAMDERGWDPTPSAWVVWNASLSHAGYTPHYLVQCTAPGYRLPGGHVSDLPDEDDQDLTPGQSGSCPSRCDAQRLHL